MDEIAASVPRSGRGLVISYHSMPQGNDRPSFVVQSLREKLKTGTVLLVTSNYDHIRKCHTEQGDAIRLPVRPYGRNISLQRVLSYWDFARQVRQLLSRTDVDVVYVCVPDYLSAWMALRKKPGARYRVIIDIVDLWPEAIPLPYLSNLLIKVVGRPLIAQLRRYLYRRADLLFSQSRHFIRRYGRTKAPQIYLPMCQLEPPAPGPRLAVRASLHTEIRILFLGSLNSITDGASLVRLCAMLAEHRRVVVSVVGGGAGLEPVARAIGRTGAILLLRGITFEPHVLEDEVASAHFGFNGYRDTTEVAVSYKAVDYLRRSLPLINRTKGDLTEVVAAYDCGINYDLQNLSDVAKILLKLDDQQHARLCANALRAFHAEFSFSHFNTVFAANIERLLIAASRLPRPRTTEEIV